MTFGFRVGSKNFCKLFSVSCEVLVLHGYDWIHWVAKSCTTTAYRWLFRDSHPSLRTLWSAVINSPKFSARCMASPVRFLQGALVVLVLVRISQFQSFGKWVLIQCFPGISFLTGSVVDSREELAGASLTSETLSFSLNSANHSGNSGNRSIRANSLSPFFICFCLFGWLRRQVSLCSFTYMLTSYCCWTRCRIHTVLRWRYVGDEGVVELEEPVYKPGTTSGT